MIGNNVYIALNVVIVGNIKNWDYVLIAPNVFVNMDVLNGIVIGNLAIIKSRLTADGR